VEDIIFSFGYWFLLFLHRCHSISSNSAPADARSELWSSILSAEVSLRSEAGGKLQRLAPPCMALHATC
jgi:hypothetical protein